MHLLSFALLLPAVLALPAPDEPTLISRAVSPPNGTCGLLLGGANQGNTCPGETACCSQYGYCGSSDQFCLTTAGCQARYSNSSSACHAPRSGVSISVDGTCGSTGVGKNGYRCPNNATIACCSASGYCGNSKDHCDVNAGCQSGFGTCTGTRTTPRSMWELAVEAAKKHWA
ncbi:carbohydrate-binding module family 18 protein [Podospora aff. communis PSN243]|uniref:Carbohydrate-binding module family 18 protein n=1 Tax=Podospora aff. communis PSN243 TaxID=3040156 RepID=A0AAV9GJQ8_9PEZI|nr:carbohydrate-binding module family 18 protein [Podospora aff. communis PSN243]